MYSMSLFDLLYFGPLVFKLANPYIFKRWKLHSMSHYRYTSPSVSIKFPKHL